MNMNKVKRAILPVFGLIGLGLFWYIILIKNILAPEHDYSWKDNSSGRNERIGMMIRCYFALVVASCMEYVARYEHMFLWHSRWLWFLHASHHHQETKFGAGPSKSDSESNKYIPPQDSVLELNDVFPLVFASTAILAMVWADNPTQPTFLHDIVYGASVGISAYGTSYFVGHDLCAHARGGKGLAEFLNRISPTMKKCAEIHKIYHHKIDADVADNDDPYGPPYGFWYGPQEVENWKEGREDPGLPLVCKVALACGGVFFIYACCC